jgi:hypothetical protein
MNPDEQTEEHSGPSLGTMFSLLLLALLLAIGIAYWILYPFFHRH